MNHLLDAALKRVRTGACVLPLWWTDAAGVCQCPKGDACPSPGKHPLLKRGLHDASCNEGDIRAWWRRWPGANVGVRTDDVARVDIDLIEVADVLAEDVALAAETEIVRTPRGGLHIALCTRAPVAGGSLYVRDGGKLGDLKAEGGYVLVPPSRIGERTYDRLSPEHGRLLEKDDPRRWLARLLPAFGFELGAGPAAGTREYGGLSGTMHEGEGRHNALVSYAGRVWIEGMGADTLAALLCEINRRQCRPPLSEDEVLEIATHFASRRGQTPGPGMFSRNGSDGRRRIVVSNRHLHEIAGDAWSALLAQNDPPVYFRHAGAIAEIENDEHGLRIVHATQARLRGRLDRLAEWVRFTEEGLKPARPPKDVVEDMEALPEPLPSLRGISGTPTFAADGAMVTDPGYHAGTRLYFAPSGEPVAAVPQVPDATDVKRAKNVLGLEWLADLPFVGDASRAHAISIPVTAVVRELIDGPTPFFAIDAPTAGTGKGLLAAGVGLIVSGGPPAVMTEERDDEELRKRITAILRAGRPLVVFDNVRRTLSSGVLAALLTATTWSDRLLGKSETIDLPNRTIWLATGNNLRLSDEVARRTVWIRLDARVDRPWQRTNFRHSDLMAWLSRHRHELVWAVLVLAQNWIARGRPQWEGEPLGSFESWSRVIGGILQVAGIDGFLANREELYSRVDAETEEWRTFTQAWWERHGAEPVKVADLLPLAEEVLAGLFTGTRANASERSLRTRLGSALAKRRDRCFGDLFIRRAGQDNHTKGALWRLENADDAASAADVVADISSASAQHPQTKEAVSDTNADAAERADSVFGSNRQEPSQANIEERVVTQNSYPQHPQHPQTDRRSLSGDADAVRMLPAEPPQGGAAARPQSQCPACNREAWWRRPDGGWVCGVCHPDPREPVAARVLFSGDGRGAR